MKLRWLAALGLLLAASAQARVLDGFDNASQWRAEHTDDVVANISNVPGKIGQAMRLQFDFAGVNGYATATRKLPLDFPANYELSFWVRGEAGVNNLQFKLVDASGTNVWWLNKSDFTFSREWQQIRIKKRQLDFAWGPTTDRTLKHNESIEFVVSSGRDGGKGFVEFDDLEMRELPPPDVTPPKPVLSASSEDDGMPASMAMDGDVETGWSSRPKDGQEIHFDIDFVKPREFGGLTLHWFAPDRAVDYDVQFSGDGQSWRTLREVRNGNGEFDALLLPESETRYVRIAMHRGRVKLYRLLEIAIDDIASGATPNAFFSMLAKHSPRGSYPRGFSEQPYWTIVGVNGVGSPALISEDGAIEPAKGGFSIEPLLKIDGKLLTWADATSTQSLADSYLPIPSATWRVGDVDLHIEAIANGTREASSLIARYRLHNASSRAQALTLALAVRPFQVNPPAQFLNSAGGVSAIRDLAVNNGIVAVNGTPSVLPLQKSDAFVTSTYDAGSIIERLRGEANDLQSTTHDPIGFASGALLYKLHLAPNAEQEIDLVMPTTGALPRVAARDAEAIKWVAQQRADVAKAWHAELDRVTIQVPSAAQFLVDALRSSIAYTLITRDGPALRPGTRSYARSWIRDGAMIEDGLLSLGNLEAAREFVE